MTITGRQIREARKLLDMTPGDLARRTKVFKAAIMQAELVDDEPAMTVPQANAIQRALERAGIEFTSEDGGAAGVRLRKSTQP